MRSLSLIMEVHRWPGGCSSSLSPVLNMPLDSKLTWIEHFLCMQNLHCTLATIFDNVL